MTREEADEEIRAILHKAAELLEASGRKRLSRPITVGPVRLGNAPAAPKKRREDCSDLPATVVALLPATRRVYRVIRAANARGEGLWPQQIIRELSQSIGGEVSKRTVNRALRELRDAKAIWKVPGRGYQVDIPPDLFSAN